MKMSYEFAKKLMNDLAMLAVLANEREPMSALEIAKTEEYTRATFLQLTTEWENEMHKRWKID